MIRCIIIDDEPLARRQMRSYVDRVDGLESLGEFGSTIEAQEFLSKVDVDLLFCDINMPEQSGVDFVKSWKQRCEEGGEVAPMVIFTTAYSEYAVEGFRLDAVDYLLKPLSFDLFYSSYKRAHSLFTLRQNAINNESQESIEEVTILPEEQFITVKSGYKSVLIGLEEILYVESVGEYIRFQLADGRAITTLYRLKNIETELPATQFVRVHRSYIVNVARVASYGRSKIYLSESDYIPIGQNYRENFMSIIANK